MNVYYDEDLIVLSAQLLILYNGICMMCCFLGAVEHSVEIEIMSLYWLMVEFRGSMNE
jgi:hypothetical protein